jgi:hypothetical protein
LVCQTTEDTTHRLVQQIVVFRVGFEVLKVWSESHSSHSSNLQSDSRC